MANLNYRKGDPNAICDICGLKKHRSSMRKTWDGWLACIDDMRCWYPKHPADSPLPVIFDGLPIHDARPEAEDVYISITESPDDPDQDGGEDQPGLSSWDHWVNSLASNGEIAWNVIDENWEDT